MKCYTFEKDFPIDSKYNILEEVDLVFVYKALHADLIENIYSRNNLFKLNYLLENFRKAVKNFRKKLKARDKPAYLMFFSFIMDWNQEFLVSLYHFIILGLENTKRK